MPDVVDAAIEHAVFVRAAPEAVYDALATAEGLDGWFTRGANVNAYAGGTIMFRWVDWGPDRITAEDVGEVVAAQRPTRFAFRWQPDGPSYSTTVSFELAAIRGGTVLRLREHGFRDTPSGRRALMTCATGWGEALTLLKFWVEHGLRY